MRYVITFVLLVGSALGQYCTGHSCDVYGGRTDWPCTNPNAPNAWSTAKVNGQWMLCTPASHGMFAVYAYSVGTPANPTAKYGSLANGYEATLTRMKYYGFNTLGPFSDDVMFPWNRTNKLSSVIMVRPGAYGMNCGSNTGLIGTLDQCVKDLQNGASPYWTNMNNKGMPDWNDMTRLNSAVNYQLTQSFFTAPQSVACMFQSPIQCPNSTSLPYLIGVFTDDSDQTWGYFTSVNGNPVTTTLLSDYGANYGGYITAVISPQRWADAQHNALYSSDQTVYVKKTWHDYLVSKYASLGNCPAQTHTGILGVNDCWGSNYTTFDSSATTVPNEVVGTTDGTTFSFTHTLANTGAVSPTSVRVYLNGSLIAGDCFAPSTGTACNPTSGTTWGALTGPTASGGTINYSTKAITVSFSGQWEYIAKITCTVGVNCQIEMYDYEDPKFGASVGSNVSVRTSTCCSLSNEQVTAKSGTATCTGDATGTCYTYTLTNAAGKSGTELWSGGFFNQAATINPPAAASPNNLTVTYEVGGWGSDYANSGAAAGTGLMDEDGRPSHANPALGGWLGTDEKAMSNANQYFKADVDGAMQQVASTFFTGMRTTIRNAFTNAGFAAPLYLGPDTMGSWSGIPTLPVVKAASGVVDVMENQAWAGTPHTTAMLNYLNQYFNGPVLITSFMHSDVDSQWSSNVGVNDYLTQESRGQAWYNLTNTMLTAGPTTTANINPYSGIGFQNWWDSVESTNWGLVTAKDNLYDLHEDSTSAVACSAPLNTGCVGAQCIGGAYPCGGEPAYTTWSSGMAVTCSGGCGSGSAPDFSTSTRIKQLVGGVPYIFQDVTAGPTATSGSAPSWACATPGTSTVTNGTDGITWQCLTRVTNASGFGDVMACNGMSNCGVTAGNQLWLSLTPGSTTDTSIGGGWTIPGGWVIH